MEKETIQIIVQVHVHIKDTESGVMHVYCQGAYEANERVRFAGTREAAMADAKSPEGWE